MWAAAAMGQALAMPPAPELGQHLELPRALAGARRNVLVVDDRLGASLVERLRARRITADFAVSLDDFLERFSHRLDEYSLAVVDLHLTDEYKDRCGEDVIASINESGVPLPVVMWTCRPLRQQTDEARQNWKRELGLVELYYKDEEDSVENLTAMADIVVKLLRGDPAARACETLETSLSVEVRKAEKKLRQRGQSLGVEHMKREAQNIAALAREGDLAAARRRLQQFVDTFT